MSLESPPQREVRQREEEKVMACPSPQERTLIFGWRGRISVCHCCCVLARTRKLKCSFFIMAYSALFKDVFEAVNLLLIILLCLCRNSTTCQWHSARLQNTEFWLEFCHVWLLVISIPSCKVQMPYFSSLY
jgi:hypothetical protein